MGKVLNHKATWFVLGAAVMYFAFPYVAPMIPFGPGKSQG